MASETQIDLFFFSNYFAARKLTIDGRRNHTLCAIFLVRIAVNVKLQCEFDVRIYFDRTIEHNIVSSKQKTHFLFFFFLENGTKIEYLFITLKLNLKEKILTYLLRRKVNADALVCDRGLQMALSFLCAKHVRLG